MQRSSFIGLTLTLVALVCAPGDSRAQGQQTPSDVALARLEQKATANPSSVNALQAVGIKYYEVKRYADGRTVLDRARQLDARCALCALYSGLSSEALRDFPAARVAYTKYLDVGKTRRVRDDIRKRLVALAKEDLKEQAKAAVANETALRGVQGDPRTIAVLPFRYTGTDTSLIPLERGMADLVVTDLSRSAQLRVLERDRMQAIADEIALSRTANVDAATATRAGKLISAGRILNGSIIVQGGNNLNLTGAVVNTQNAQIGANGPSVNGTLDAIFRLQKEFVERTFTALGVTLTAAERAEFDKRPTQNFNAFMAYSRGLMAEDAGRMDEAVRFFESARSQDPGFTAALQRAQSAAAASAGTQVSSAKVEQGLRNTAEGNVVAAAQSGSTSDVTLAATLNNTIGNVNPTNTNTVQNSTSGGGGGANTPQQQNQVAQTTGTNQPAQLKGQIVIVIKRP